MRSLKTKESGRQGFSLIEVMIAVLVLAIGLVGGAAVIAVAIANNGRSRVDTTAIALAESTMEKIVAIPVKSAATVTTSLTDCTGNVLTINTASAAAPGAGAALQANGNIDFTEANPPANYSMLYVACTTAQTYDIRWHVDNGPTPATHVVTVGAKSLGQLGNTGGIRQQTIFALPANIKTLRGNL